MSRDAYIHARRPATADADAPLLFAFHGTGGDETQLLDLAAELLPGAEIVAPRGDVSEHGAARFFRRLGEGLYDMADVARAADKTAGFIRAWKAEAAGRPALAIGYSNGANVLASAMIAHPDLLDGAALMHPLIPWAPDPAPGLGGKRVLITSGARDPICPPPATEALIAYLRAQGARVSATEHPGGHEIRPEELAAVRDFLVDR